MPSPASSTPVQRRHREAAVRKLLPNTGPLSWVWTSYVERGDSSAPQLRDVHAEAQRLADDDEAAQPKPEPAPVPPLSPSSGLVMSPRYEEKDDG